MFSKNVQDVVYIIEYFYIAGVAQDKLNELDNTIQSHYIEPDVFFVQQRNDLEEFNQSILNFCFPQGIEVTKRHIPSYFYSFPLTNEKGERSYNYSLILYERSSHNDYYLPVILSVNSHLDDHDSFKEILGEILLILNNNNNSNSNSNANIELLNFFLFNYNLLIPPNHCLMGINYKYSTVNMYFPSVSEIPTTLNDSNMRILFSILDIRIIIKLYMCLLTERKIVLVSKKDNCLSNICNALFRLIFPFKWMHTFIPLIDEEQIDVLEAPIPYIIGLVTSTPNYIKLTERFKESVFVDVDTNDMYLPKNMNDIHLGKKEERELKNVLQKIKNAELLLNEEDNHNSSVNVNLGFGTNVQKIFFRLIEKVIHNYYKYIELSENEYFPFYGEKLKVDFKEDKFMEDLLKKADEYTKATWEKIINANGFLDFINNNLTPQQLTNTFIFNHIVDGHHNKQKEGNNILNSYVFNMNINDIKEELINTLLFNENETNKNKISELHNEFKTFYSNNSTVINKDFVNISNKQTNLYLNIIHNKSTYDVNPLVSSLYFPLSNQYKYLNKNETITFKFYGDKGFICFIKEIKSIPKWKELLHYHLIQISNELNSDINKPLYFNFLQEHTNITQHYDKFFKLILTAFYIREEMITNQHLTENKTQKLQQLSSLYEEAWNINHQEFPYYKYYKIVNELKALQDTTPTIEQESIIENIFKYEILPVKISEFQTENIPKQQINNNNNKSSFIEKLSQQIAKENKNIISKHNINDNDNSEMFSINSVKALKTNLKNPIIINKKFIPPLQQFIFHQIIDELFPLLSTINETHKNNLSKAIHSITETDFISIQNNIAALKKINLSKISGTNNKVCFWLNLFNILVIFTLIYTQQEPNSVTRWKEVLKNAKYDIGGYEICLRDLYFQILNVNFLVDQASQEKQKWNKFINRFAVTGLSELEQYLLVFGLYLPGFHGTNLTKFNSENLFKQLGEILKDFVATNVKFDRENKFLFITEEFLSFDMNFVFGSFRLCKEFLDEEMYEILNEPKYMEIKMLPPPPNTTGQVEK